MISEIVEGFGAVPSPNICFFDFGSVREWPISWEDLIWILTLVRTKEGPPPLPQNKSDTSYNHGNYICLWGQLLFESWLRYLKNHLVGSSGSVVFVWGDGMVFNVLNRQCHAPAGNAFDPLEKAEEYGLDALKYFLLRESSFSDDGAFPPPSRAEAPPMRVGVPRAITCDRRGACARDGEGNQPPKFVRNALPTPPPPFLFSNPIGVNTTPQGRADFFYFFFIFLFFWILYCDLFFWCVLIPHKCLGVFSPPNPVGFLRLHSGLHVI